MPATTARLVGAARRQQRPPRQRSVRLERRSHDGAREATREEQGKPPGEEQRVRTARVAYPWRVKSGRTVKELTGGVAGGRVGRARGFV